MSSQAVRSKVVEIAGTLASASTKVDLAASYADVGSAVDIAGASDLTLDLAEIANSEDADVKAFLSMEEAEPTSTTGLFQLVNVDGTEVVIVVTQNTRQLYEMAASGLWCFLQGKGSAGTAADLRAFLNGNFRHDVGGSRFVSRKIAIASTAVAVGASATAVGSIIDITGMGNLTLFVQNTDLSVSGVISVYLSNADTQPASTATMVNLKTVVPAARTFTTLANEKAAHPIGRVSGKWLGLTATGNGADLIVYLVGTLNGVIG